jgi:hypothetical protein
VSAGATYRRICLKDFSVKAANGDIFTILRGEEYLTSDVNEQGKVVIFARHPGEAPSSIFSWETPYWRGW